MAPISAYAPRRVREGLNVGSRPRRAVRDRINEVRLLQRDSVGNLDDPVMLQSDRKQDLESARNYADSMMRRPSSSRPNALST